MPLQQQHRYESCRDPDCERPYCRIWREGRAEGWQEGYQAGYVQGYEDGYAQGFPDGIMACPRNHEG